MASPTGTGVKRHEPEGLGGGGVNYVPQVQAHLIRQYGQLVYQPDVDRAEGVLQQLGHLRLFGGAHGNYSGKHWAVVLGRSLGRALVNAANQLWYVADSDFMVTGVYPLRRKRQKEVFAGCQPRFH